jgi:hypothetical protein
VGIEAEQLISDLNALEQMDLSDLNKISTFIRKKDMISLEVMINTIRIAKKKLHKMEGSVKTG